MASRVFGRATIIVNGKVVLSDVGASFQPSGFSRNTVKGDVVHGFTETAEEAVCELTQSMDGNTDLDGLNANDDITVNFITDTGQSWTMPHAWQANVSKVTSGQGGKIPQKFCAVQSQRVS